MELITFIIGVVLGTFIMRFVTPDEDSLVAKINERLVAYQKDTPLEQRAREIGRRK